MSYSNISSTISLYPNPTSGSFLLNTSENVNITMFDITGRMVKQLKYTNQAVSVEGLNAGIYVVQIENNGVITTQKLIVK